MVKRSPVQKVLALVLAAALWLAMMPWQALAARAEEGGYVRVRSGDALTDGSYVLVDSGGYGPLLYDGENGWITAARPGINGDTVPDPLGAVWTLTVTSQGVILRDRAGTCIAPVAGGENGITAGEYAWSVTWNGDAVSFYGTGGETAVTLARNGDSGYRAFRKELVEGYPEGYPNTFRLYKFTAEAAPPQETTAPTETLPSTEGTTEPTLAPTQPSTEPSTAPTGPVLAGGNYVIWWEGIALSSQRLSDSSRYYAGTKVQQTGSGLTGYTTREVWTLAWDGETCTLSCGEERLGTTADYAGISYGTGDTRWVLEPEGTGYRIRNAVSGRYVRYAPDFECWTSGKTWEEATVVRFTIGDAPAQPEIPTQPTETEPTAPPETQPTEAPERPAAGAVAMTPDGGEVLPGTVTLSCETEGAAIFYATSSNGETFSDYVEYQQPITLKKGFVSCYIRAYAQADGLAPGEITTRFFVEQEVMGRGLYFGQLHAHCEFSGGTGTVEEAYAYAAQVPNLDFLALTDHSHSFDNALSGSIREDGGLVSAEWAAGKAAAKAATNRDFVGIYGYEMAWPEKKQLGHINTFNTPGFQSRDQGGYQDIDTALPNYYDALTTVSGSVSQFNHPGTMYGSFRNFGYYSSARDEAIQLLEVGTGADAYDYYHQALDAGWHVAPAANQNNRSGQWGNTDERRTVVLADSLTEAGIYDAIRNYRVYATQDRDLEITYTLDDYPMGSMLEKRDVGQTVTLRVSVADATDGTSCLAAVVSEGGKVLEEKLVTGGEVSFALSSSYSYYYIRITQPDGDTAATAPVWIDGEEDVGILAFTADTTQPEPGQEVELTLSLYNNEKKPVNVEKIEFFVEDTAFYTTREIAAVSPGGTAACRVPLTWSQPGQAVVRAKVTALLGSEQRIFEASVTLHYLRGEGETELFAIGDARRSETGTPCTLRGYVTAGNSDPYNTFPDAIYLQDETGGIAVTCFTGNGVEIGTPLEVTGTVAREGGNVVLEAMEWKLLEGDRYRYVAESLPLGEAMNVTLHGGELLKVQGKVVAVTPLGDTGVSRFQLKDDGGNIATVDIESGILSGSTGRNELAYVVKVGRTVRAVGILHLASDGEPVLRVRNCDEVIYVPSLPYTPDAGAEGDASNPKTGDRLLPGLAVIAVCIGGLLLAVPWKRKK